MLREENKICKLCNKTMPIIGKGRKNGKKINNSNGKDWINDPKKPRLYHKKCWKIIKDREYWKRYYAELKKEQETTSSDDDYNI
tara:strand:- start:6628 stop:6879 length:252 start_codon:yes stop_codon:yes gene_type:complete